MIHKEDIIKECIKKNKGYLTLEILSKISGIQKHILLSSSCNLQKKGLIKLKVSTSAITSSNGIINQSEQQKFSLIDTIILLGSFNLRAKMIETIQLCKEQLLRENND